MYPSALICVASCFPNSIVTGFSPCVFNPLITWGSNLKSVLQATNITGHWPQKCRISGIHLSITFTADAGWLTQKHIRTIWVSEYDRGRRRSKSSSPAVSKRPKVIYKRIKLILSKDNLIFLHLFTIHFNICSICIENSWCMCRIEWMMHEWI
jgi:hypothetical protein